MNSENKWELLRFWPLFIVCFFFVVFIIVALKNKKTHLTYNLSNNNPLNNFFTFILYKFSFLLLFIVSILLLIASMEISKVTYNTETEAEQSNILFVLDISPSMAAKDMAGLTRWQAVTKSLIKIIEGSSNREFGIIVFADTLSMLVPLTRDYQAIIKDLQNLELGNLGLNTALADAILYSYFITSKNNNKNTQIIVLTDGKQNSGKYSLSQASAIINNSKQNISLLFIDSLESTTFSFYDKKTNSTISGTLVPSDNKLIQDFTQVANIDYYPISSPEQIDSTLLSLLNTTSVIQHLKTVLIKKNVSDIFLIWALILFLIFLAIRHIVLKVIC